VDVLITAPLVLSTLSGTSSLSVCVLVSVSVLPSDESAKWLTFVMSLVATFGNPVAP